MGVALPASSARSLSTCSGSSGKNAGVALCAVSVKTAQARAASGNSQRVLEDMAEPQDEVGARGAAERTLDAEEDPIDRAESEADADVGLQIVQIDILETWGDLAGVVEDRAVHGGEDLPAVFRLEQEHVAVTESKVSEAAKIIGAAERSLEIERDFGPRVRIGRRDQRVQRHNTTVAQQRDVLLQVHVDAVEREPAAAAVIVSVIRQRVAPASAGIASRL